MNKIRNMLRNGFIAGLIMLLVGAMPVPVSAEDSVNGSGSAAPTTHTMPPTNGTTGPTGAASWTYSFNHGTGLWENDYYTYDPATHVTTPKSPLEYTYNHGTGMWDAQVWQYSAAKGAYVQTPVSVTTPPSGAITHGGPVAESHNPEHLPSSGSEGHDSHGTDAHHGGHTSDDSAGSSPSNHHKSEQTPHSTGTHSDGQLTFSNSGTITNLLNSQAQSGDSTVIANTTAGNVGTGDASAMANIINLLQSQSAFGGQGMATFTANIQGNVQGDFVIDPAHYMQPAGGAPTNGLTNLKVNTQDEGVINNTVNLDATSGTAEATKNTTVGNVTSGDANAIANVVNMINSVVAANQSFMGVINIHGDYAGNILMPTESLNSLLASAGSDRTTAVATDVSNASEQHINNDVDLSAVSGTAAASQNTTSGNVASGDGLTNLTLMNLTGRQVVAANSLLVFVNVLGNWVGLIMDAPAGTTSAALGGGVSSDKTAALAQYADVENSQKFGINNDINANARSGDALGSQNTTIGDIRSGDATASANVANIIGSNFSLSNWFGVLFINVFGTWRGNFGVAKPPIVPPITTGASGVASGAVNPVSDMRVFTFTPKTDGGGNSDAGGGLGLSPLSEAAQNGSVDSQQILDKVSKVLASTNGKQLDTAATASPASDKDFNWSGLVLALGLAGFGFVGVDRVRTNLRNRRYGVRN